MDFLFEAGFVNDDIFEVIVLAENGQMSKLELGGIDNKLTFIGRISSKILMFTLDYLMLRESFEGTHGGLSISQINVKSVSFFYAFW